MASVRERLQNMKANTTPYRSETAQRSSQSVQDRLNNMKAVTRQNVAASAGLVASNAANRVAQMSQTDQYRFNQDQTAANLESVQNNSDFQDVVSRTRGDIYLSGNVFTGDAQARNTVRDIQLLNRDESGEWAKDNFDNAVLYMTPEQQDTMLYYAGTNQWDKASEYLDSIRYRLNQEEMQALTQRTREVSEANPLLGALTNISAGFLSPVAYGANAIQGIRNAITGENVPTDTNSDLFLGAQLSQASREGVSAAGERMPILGNIEVGGQNLGSFAAGIGLDLGRVVSRLPFGPAGALALSGAGAAGEQTLDILNRGGTQGQAALSGAASGLIEAATEKIGLDNLFSIFGRTGQQGLRSVLRSVARQAGIEASEEAISEVLNTVADTAIMRENSTYEQAISNYMAQGMTREEATGAANRDVLANTAWAAAGGALSGGILGGGASVVNTMQNRVTLPTAEQGGRLPGGETVQTEQQNVEMPQRIDLQTAAQRMQNATQEQNNTASTGETVSGLVPITDREAVSLSTGRNNIIAWIKKGKNPTPIPDAGMSTNPEGNARSALESSSSENSITQTGQNVNTLKQRQLQVIQDSNAAPDPYHTWVRDESDILTFEEALNDPDWADYDEFDPSYSADMARQALSSGEITVYSSYPIETGVFVTPSRMEAESYAGSGQVYERTVPLTDVAWIDPTQGQYAPVGQVNENVEGVRGVPVSPEETADYDRLADIDPLPDGVTLESEVPPVVQRLSQALGRNIQMYDGSREGGTRGTANGYYSNGTIYVNSNTANPVAQVIAHELTHSVEMADAYQDLQNLIFERIQQTGGNLEQMRAQKADLYQRNGVNLNAQDLDAEIVAEYVEKNLLTDEASIQELTRTNRTLAQRIRDWIDSILAKLGNTDAQSRVFLERARDAYSRALQQTQGTVDTVATVDTVGSVASQRQVQSLLDQYDSGAITQEQLIEQATRLLEGETQYSISETDSDGNALTSEQLAYFQNSKVVDENGNLLVMYHGTNANKDFTVFDTYGGNFGLFGVGSYFTDNADVARSYTKKGRGTNERVYSVYLNIKNPLDMDAPFDQSAWKLPSEVQDYVRDAKTNEEAYRGLKEYCQDEGMYKWEAEEYLFDIVSDQFDGITHVGGGRYGSKDGPRHRVYIAFSPEQIKRVDNLSPTTSPDIRYSLDENQRNQFISMLREYARGNWNEQTIREYLNLVKQHGEYDQGANAARPVLVPKKDAQGNPVRRTARTAMGAKAIPESVASDIANLVRTGQMSYERVGDKASTQRAIQRIQNDGFDRSLEYFSQNVRKGIASKDMVTLGQQLLVNAANAGDGRRTAEILQLYTQMGTSIGQAEQAFSILRKLDPSDQLYAIQKTVSNLEEEIQKRFKDKNITIDPALLEEFQNQTDDARRDAVKEKIYQNVADQIPSNWRDKWNAWRYMAMLVNPRTHIRNVAGNLLFQPVRMVKDKVAATMETFVHAINPNFEKTKSFVANPDLYRAAWSDFKNVKDILSGNKYDDIRSEINSRRTVFGGVLGKPFEAVRTGNSWALEAEDIIFKRLTYADALSGYLQSRGVTGEQLRSGNVDSNLLSAARDYAGQEALKATYQDKNQFSDLLSRRFQENNTAGKVANAAIDAVLPFRRTPANILVRGFEYSPLGLAKSLTADLVQVKRGNMSGAQAIDNIAAGLTGSGLFALGAMLLAQGIVTSGGDESEEQNDLNDLTGKQNYALNLPGGGSVTLDWLAPESLPFFMGVEFMDALGEGGSVMETITSALTSISEPMLELSMLQSLNDLIDSVSFAESSGKLVSMAGSALISYLTQAIPTLGGQIERTTEENRMSSFTDRNSSVPRDVQYAISRSSARLPGDYQQIPYIDAWGRTESSGNILDRAFNNLLNPAYTSTVNQTAADEEIQRLLDAGMTGVVPDRVSQSQKVDDQYMTANEYVEYATTRGQTSYEIVSDMIDSDLYQSMTDEQKADAIKRAYQYASHVAAETIHPGHESEAYVTEAQQADSAAEYLLLYEKYGSSGTKRYSELMDAGLDGEAAETVLDTMDGLTGDVTSIQRYRAIVDSGISESDQMAALSQYMTESEYRKLSSGYDYGVSPDDYITFRETLPSFDENGNGSFTQAETEAALNSLSGSGLILPGFTGVNLTNDQKAVLWQLQGSNWSWRNNPYNTAIGRQVYNLLNQEEGSGFSGLLTLPTA